MLFFTTLATLLIVYVIYAITKGEIRAPGQIVREDSPQAFWTVTLIYMAVGLFLLALV